MRRTIPIALALLLGAAACGGDATTVCGAGTLQEGSACVPDPDASACGPGTTLQSGQCVAAGDATGSPADSAAPDSAVGPDAAAPDAAKPPVPAAWTCPPERFADGGDCDCGCGALDADCLLAGHPVTGCTNVGAACGVDGACVGGAPPGWTCAPWKYADGATCECACGLGDPDCAAPHHPVVGCPEGAVCNADGSCGDCVPDCAGQECGGDGCGGSCGACLSPAAPHCSQGVCAAACVPDCAATECGPDGCGGLCGACAAGTACLAGHCAALSPDLSCDGHCGGAAPGGCRCDAGCVPGVECCDDRVAACGCQPACDGRECGPDGCGGTCGACPNGEACTTAGQCLEDPCLPDPCSGHGQCLPDGSCGCDLGFAGDACDQCAPAHVGYPECTLDPCDGVTCAGHGTCDGALGCVCDAGYGGPGCGACAEGYLGFPDCAEIPAPTCGELLCGAVGICDPAGSGACVCNAGFEGADCGVCVDTLATWPDCGPLDWDLLQCHGFGTAGAVGPDGPEGPCTCDPGFAGDRCETCLDAGATWPACAP